jgi:hypothetical protein
VYVHVSYSESILKVSLNNIRKGKGSRDSAVGIVTGYVMDFPGLNPGRTRIFSPPQREDRLWAPFSFLFNEYPGRFPSGKAAGLCPGIHLQELRNTTKNLRIVTFLNEIRT